MKYNINNNQIKTNYKKPNDNILIILQTHQIY